MYLYRPRSLTLIAVSLCLLPLLYNRGFAQFTGSGTQRSACSVVIDGLPHVPELHTDMTLDCLIGYVAMDSAARIGSIPAFLRVSPSLMPDFIRVPARYIYAMKDYDPVLFYRHFRSIIDSIPPRYRINQYPYDAIRRIIMEYYKDQEKFGRDFGLLVVSDYILHIKVDEARSGTDSTFYPSTLKWTNVACHVLDNFKGQYLPNNCRLVDSQNKRGKEQTFTSNCLVYGHLTEWQYIPKPGDEFIIFLDILPLTDSMYILYPNHGFGKKNGGRFRIVDGRVEDPDNIFGLGTSPSLVDFTKKIKERIREIYGYTYQEPD